MLKLNNQFLILFITLFFTLSVKSQDKQEKIIEIVNWTKDIGKDQIEVALDTLSYAEKQTEDDYTLGLVYSAYSKIFVSKFLDFEKANQYAEEIHSLGIENQDPKIIALYHNTLGECYHYEGIELQRAFEEFETAKNILSQNEIPVHHNVLNNFGLHYLEVDQADSALYFMKQSFRAFNKSPETKDLVFVINNRLNMGVCHIYLNQLDSAELYFLEAFNVAVQSGIEIEVFETLVYLGIFYQENERLKEAEYYLFEAEKYIDCDASYSSKKLLYEGIVLVYETKGDYKNAYNYNVKQNIYNDSIHLTGLKEQMYVRSYLNKLDSLENEKKILELNNKMAYQKNKYDNKIYRNRIYSLMLVSISIILLLFFLLYIINKRRKFNLVLADNEKLEKEQIKKSAEIELLKKENALLATTAEMSIQKNEVDNIKGLLESHIVKSSDPEFDKLKLFLKKLKNTDNNKSQLKHIDAIISSTDGGFFNDLRAKHSNLTIDDIRLCALLRLNISTEELSKIFNISSASIRTKKYRLKKKLSLESTVSLEDYIASLSVSH